MYRHNAAHNGKKYKVGIYIINSIDLWDTAG